MEKLISESLNKEQCKNIDKITKKINKLIIKIDN